MDIVARLALMSKANQVFGGPGIFLSFPFLGPISYKPQDLDFANPVSSPEVMHALADLSLNVNTLPSGTLFPGAIDTSLWQACSGWLGDMVLAEDQMTADELAQYDQAKALLIVKDADGFPVDSPELVAYKQFRDAWFSATQDYAGQKITADLSKDPPVLKHWTEVDEPRLRALVDQAMSDWENKGNKAQVENAQQLESQLAARSPSTVKNEWVKAHNPDLDLLTDPTTNLLFALTAFSPVDLLAQDWPTFQLTQDEIVQLAQSAPDELRQFFLESGKTSTITSLSFEFRSAALLRPWLNSAMFSARFWKFREGWPPLSDGAASPKGSWPAYISAVVFARNIQMTTQTAPQSQPVPSFPPVSRAILSNVALARLTRAEPTPGTGAPSAHLHPLASMPVVSGGTIAKPLTPMFAPEAVPGIAPVSPGTRLFRASYRTRVQVGRLAGASDVATSDAPSSPTVTSTVDNDVSILAFICRKLAQTPNPDPALTWP